MMVEESVEEDMEVVLVMKERTSVQVELQETKLERFFRSICLNGAVLVLGLSFAVIGVVLVDLEGRTQTNHDEITKIFVGRGFGFLVGSIGSVYLLGRANQSSWITFALILLAVVTATIPSCTSLALLVGTLFLQGAFCGIIKAGCNVVSRQNFARSDLTPNRSLYVSFGAGAFLVSLLFVPFAGNSFDAASKLSPPPQLQLQRNPDFRTSTPFYGPSTTTTLTRDPERDENAAAINPNVLAKFHRKRRESDDAAVQTAEDLLKTLMNLTNGADFRNSLNTNMADDSNATTFANGTSDNDTKVGRKIKIGENRTFLTDDDAADSSDLFDVELPNNGSTNPDLLNVSRTAFNETSFVSANATENMSIPLSFPLNTSSVLSSTTSAAAVKTTTVLVAKKPAIASGDFLSRDHKVADGSKYRLPIRENLKKDIPDVVGLRTPETTSINSLTTTTTRSHVDANVNSLIPSSTMSTTILNSGLKPPSSTTLTPSSKAVKDPPASPSDGFPRTTSTTLSPGREDMKSQLPILETPNNVGPANTNIPELPTITSLPVSTSFPPTKEKEVVADKLDNESYKSLPRLTGGAAWSTKYGYWLSAFFVCLVATIFAFYWVLCPRVYQLGGGSGGGGGVATSEEDVVVPDGSRSGVPFRPTVVLAAAAAFHFAYAGLEVALSVLVTTYPVVRWGWTWRRGLLLNAAFWGSFTFYRLLSSLFGRCCRLSAMMFGGLLLCVLVVGGALITLGHRHSGVETSSYDVVVWILVAMLGFGMAAILPGGANEIEKILPRESEIIGAVGASVAEMALPPAIGVVMTIGNTVWIAYTFVALFSMCIAVSMAIRYFAVRLSEPRLGRSSRSLPTTTLEHDYSEDVAMDTNDETELLSKNVLPSQTGSPLTIGNANNLQGTSVAIQSLMKNISNVKKD